MSISIITLSKDKPEFFRKCAKSVAKQNRDLITDKILVQNGTDTETEDIATQYGWKILKPGYNTSFSEGCNLAAKQAEGTALLLLNNDAELCDGALQALEDRRGLSGILGTYILYENGVVNHAGMGFSINPGGVTHETGSYYGAYYPCHIGRREPQENHPHSRYCPAVTFACVLIERSIWLQLGGLDEAYYYSYEDVDFCLKYVEQYGQFPYMVREAEVFHNECGTRNPVQLDPKNAVFFAKRWLKTFRLHDAIGLVQG